jgi:hypothetical protein
MAGEKFGRACRSLQTSRRIAAHEQRSADVPECGVKSRLGCTKGPGLASAPEEKRAHPRRRRIRPLWDERAWRSSVVSRSLS